MWIWPYLFIIFETNLFTSSSFVTSALTSCTTDLVSAFRYSISLSTTYDDITLALHSMKALIIARPKAPVPPVTNTVLFEKSYLGLFRFSIRNNIIIYIIAYLIIKILTSNIIKYDLC